MPIARDKRSSRLRPTRRSGAGGVDCERLRLLGDRGRLLGVALGPLGHATGLERRRLRESARILAPASSSLFTINLGFGKRASSRPHYDEPAACRWADDALDFI